MTESARSLRAAQDRSEPRSTRTWEAGIRAAFEAAYAAGKVAQQIEDRGGAPVGPAVSYDEWYRQHFPLPEACGGWDPAFPGTCQEPRGHHWPCFGAEDAL